jgi:hypothetical protein
LGISRVSEFKVEGCATAMDVESDSGDSSGTSISVKFFRRAKRFIALIAFAAVLVLEFYIVYASVGGGSGGTTAVLRRNFTAINNATEWLALPSTDQN